MLKTAESVTPRHPDKLCDRISDAILDECLKQDPLSRVAIETMGGHGIITITGELTTDAFVDAREIAQRIAGTEYGVQVNIVKQSTEIAGGVDTGGAGDQGIMVGYATEETPELIPLEVKLSRDLAKYLYELFPVDGKTQITVNEHGTITAVVASFQSTTVDELRHAVFKWLDGKDTLGSTEGSTAIHCNPAGVWDMGGFEADTGLTGRKLAVDNYGPQIPIGGGCFSGKDASKVDRSAAYAARQEAVRILKEFKKEHPIAGPIEVFVKLAYAIGHPYPVMGTYRVVGLPDETTLTGSTFQTGSIDDLERFTPKAMRERLELNTPVFEKTAEWGHFGNNFKWDN